MAIKKKTASRSRSAAKKTASQSTTLRGFLTGLAATAAAALALALGVPGVDFSTISTGNWRQIAYALPLPAEAVVWVGQTERFSQCSEFFPHGAPPALRSASGKRSELCFSDFALLHDGNRKTPVFVVERLNRKSLQQARGIERTDRFYEEARLPRAHRATLEDYRGSGYSRGHMAPAADMGTERGMAQSFSLANMIPQNQTQNAGPWSKVEQDTRHYAQRAKGDVFVFTGPVYSGSTKTIGPNKVAVPSHMFKLVYDAETGRSWAHWQANNASAKMSSPISYSELVKRTGLKLLPELP